MNEAIRIAIEKGGYRSYYYDHGKGFYQRDWVYVVNDELNTGVFQNPFFWKSLGRALGWREGICKTCGIEHYDIEEGQLCNCRPWIVVDEWERYAHRWLDSHFEGETAEKEFWDNLIKKELCA